MRYFIYRKFPILIVSYMVRQTYQIETLIPFMMSIYNPQIQENFKAPDNQIFPGYCKRRNNGRKALFDPCGFRISSYSQGLTVRFSFTN